MPGDARLDVAAVKTLLGGAYAGFAATEKAEELAGSVSGTVPPFTRHEQPELIADHGLLEAPTLYFDAARPGRALHMPPDMPPAARPLAAPPLFDAHLHVIDPRFPLVPNAGYTSPVFTVGDYRDRTAHLHVVGGAVVSGSFQAFDQTYLTAALAALGPGFVGVTQLPVTVADERVLALDRVGVRAVRFNLHRGGSESVTHLDALARRVFDLAGWHTELYLDAADLPDLAPTLTALPRITVDHLGLTRAGLPHLLDLVERGAGVKATGFGRVDLDVPRALRAIARVNPGALMAGTDLPSTRARRPFADQDLDLITDVLDPDLAPGVLHDNAAALYHPASRPPDRS